VVSFASLLDHRVYIERDLATGSDDEWGQPTTIVEVSGPIAASIQPKRVREVALITSGGASIGDYTVFMLPRRIAASDAIIHEEAMCGKPSGQDYPDLRFEVTGVRNAAGRGHHLEVDCQLIGETTGVAGS
jgi:hypothetical protein